MAFSENPTFEDLLARIERREKTSRRRAVLYTLIPITMAIVLLAYTANRVQRATDQVLDLKIQASRYKEQTTQLRNQITDLQTKLADAEKRVQEATEFGRYIHPIDLIDLKVIYSKYPREARILERILDLRQSGVKWRLGGQTPTEGFDSPSFAAFVLRQLNLPGGEVRPGESLVASSRRLCSTGPSKDLSSL